MNQGTYEFKNLFTPPPREEMITLTEVQLHIDQYKEGRISKTALLNILELAIKKLQ